MVGKVSAAILLPQPTVNNFAGARRWFWMASRLHIGLSLCPFSRLGGPGLLTTSRSNDFELYRPARRAGLGPLTTTQEGVAD